MLLVAAAAADAQGNVAALAQRMTALAHTKPSAANCRAQLAGATQADAPDLLDAGRLCTLTKLPVERAF